MAVDLRARFFSNLTALRNESKYSDVSIQVEDTIYHCHRNVLAAASSYFNAMFDRGFAETDPNNRPVVLQNIEVTPFESVLQFLYTQCVPEINISNLEELLTTSNYFGILEIEDACVSFIEENVSIIDNEFVLQLLLFAHASNIDSLILGLSQHIVENLHVFPRGDTFLKIPPDVLMELLVCRLCHLSDIGRLIINEDAALEAIIRWTFDSPHREKRRKHFKELIGMIDMDRISREYVEFCLERYNLNICKAVEPQFDNVFSPGDRATDAASPILSENIPTLHVYVQDMLQRSVKIISANKYKPDWFVSSQRTYYSSADYNMESAVLSNPDRLYCLKVNRNGMLREQIFRSYSSVNDSLINSTESLSTLPLQLQSFNLTVAKNSVYLYDLWMDSLNSIDERRVTDLKFNSENIRRGIYRYDCELDKWFPVPRMKSRMRGACMTSASNLVYLIGGFKHGPGTKKTLHVGYVQAYDYRVSRWIKLPKTREAYSNLARSCSSPDGKVYVSDGSNIEVFDPVAGRWELIRHAVEDLPYGQSMYLSKMVCYENMLWLAGMTVGHASTTLLSNWIVATYDLISREWCISEPLNRSIEMPVIPSSLTAPSVKNLVVFNPPSNYLYL